MSDYTMKVFAVLSVGAMAFTAITIISCKAIKSATNKPEKLTLEVINKKSTDKKTES